ncbi:aspartic peptidase domain-containing protein [Suillus spraguei]|nr:aspartic peptidase domain-containing protein [Suillus spraguei]
MFLAASLLTVLLALSITRSSVVDVRDSLITLPLARRLNLSNAHLAAFRDYGTHGRRADSILVKTTTTFLDYQVQVSIGEPPTTYKLVVNTGSPITWFGASTTYKRTDTSVMSGRRIKTNYGDQSTGTQCSFSGMTYNNIIRPIFYDTVTLGGLAVTWFQLGVASTLLGFCGGEDGIPGIGPEDLPHRNIKNDRGATIPSFTDYLYLQGKIGRQVVGVFCQPVAREPDGQFGELTFGTDSTKYVATPPHRAIGVYRINQKITYGQTTILGFTAGIVDPGTTLLHLASGDQTTDLLRIPPNRYNTLQNLDFHIGYTMFSRTPGAQIWPRSLNTEIPHAVVGAIYLIVRDIGGRSGRGFDFILGYTFIQHFYTVFDGSSSLVGFALTQFTSATTDPLL